MGTKGSVCEEDTGFREITHQFKFVNNFKVPLLVERVYVESNKFKIINEETFNGLKWQAGKYSPEMKIKYRTNETGGNLFTTLMHLETNVSTLSIPINVYHGHCFYSVLQMMVIWTIRSFRQLQTLKLFQRCCRQFQTMENDNDDANVESGLQQI